MLVAQIDGVRGSVGWGAEADQQRGASGQQDNKGQIVGAGARVSVCVCTVLSFLPLSPEGGSARWLGFQGSPNTAGAPQRSFPVGCGALSWPRCHYPPTDADRRPQPSSGDGGKGRTAYVRGRMTLTASCEAAGAVRLRRRRR